MLACWGLLFGQLYGMPGRQRISYFDSIEIGVSWAMMVSFAAG